MPRQPGLNSPWTLHHVIVRGIEKRNIVDDKDDRANMLSCLCELTEETKICSKQRRRVYLGIKR